MKKLSFNSQGGTYSYAGDTIFDLLNFDVFPSGNTLFQIATQSQSRSIYKIDLQGHNIFPPIQSGYYGGLGRAYSSAVHATPDEGLIYAYNHASWVGYYFEESIITKINSNGNASWTRHLPPKTPTTGQDIQNTYDIARMANGNYACLAMDSIYIFTSNGQRAGNYNFFGPGYLQAFSNGDLFIQCTGFTGRIDSSGNIMWQTSNQIIHCDTTLYSLNYDTLYKLNGMTGNSISSVALASTSLPKILLLKDGGWCQYGTSSLQRFDSLGNLKWSESFQLPANLFGEQSDGTLFTGGTYHSKLAYPFVDLDFSAYIGTIDTNGRSILDSTSQISPGDANDDGILEFGDEVYMALAQGSTGPNRYDSILDNGPQYLDGADIAVDFPGNNNRGLCLKQCDVYIDGVIDSLDILYSAYASLSLQYYTPWRLKGPNSISNNSVLPYFSILPDKDSANAGDTVRVYFALGNNGILIDSIFGLAFSIQNYSGTWVYGSLDASYLDCSLGQQNEINFKYVSDGDYFGILAARRDLRNAYYVADTIGYVDLQIAPSLSQTTDIYLNIWSFKAITADGVPIDFQFDIHPIHANRMTTNISEIGLDKIQLSPNPANYETSIINLPEANVEIKLVDLLGKECLTTNSNRLKSVNLNLSSIKSGMYILQMTDENHSKQTLKLIVE
ncbi:MAG TPA: T9SS type A sorting domain-containing protein [Bacteroidia bacterium]|nr:T9SS type A sorting domain-containing protein [Bacteroidia bacterium]